MAAEQIIDLDGLVLHISADAWPLEGEEVFVGDWLPKIRVEVRAPGLTATQVIDPAKAQEIAMALRVAIGQTRGEK